jgi:hypothetical protein
MNALAASCTQAGAELVRKGAFAEAAAYFWMVRRFAPSQDPQDPVSIYQGLLFEQIQAAIAAKDGEAALRLDGITAIFDPSARSRISPEQAAQRSAARALDADRASGRQDGARRRLRAGGFVA